MDIAGILRFGLGAIIGWFLGKWFLFPWFIKWMTRRNKTVKEHHMVDGECAACNQLVDNMDKETRHEDN